MGINDSEDHSSSIDFVECQGVTLLEFDFLPLRQIFLEVLVTLNFLCYLAFVVFVNLGDTNIDLKFASTITVILELYFECVSDVMLTSIRGTKVMLGL